MQQPNYIKEKMVISLIAPSFGCTTEPYKTRLKEAIKKLQKMNYKIKEGPNIYLAAGVCSSNTPELRAKEFMDSYLDPESNLILSVGGGELMNEILPFIDFQKIKNLPPKWFMGFSDNTNLTFTLTTLCNIKTIYGPNAPSFFRPRLQYANLDAIKMLKGEKNFKGYNKFELEPIKDDNNPLTKLNLKKKKIITPYKYEKPFEGIMLGGCLDCLINLCGTKYDNVKEFTKNKEIIWFLEACDLDPLGIRRALFELKEAGWFKTATGFIIGRAMHYNDDIFGLNRITAVTGILGDLNLPILLDIDLGHLSPSMPIMTGAKAKVSYKDENIFIDYLD